MSAEILKITPPSGEFPKIHFGEHFVNPLWIRFVDNDLDNWMGCFSSDYPNVLNKVLVDCTNESAFVVSGGVGYLVDIKNRILKHKTDDQPLIESAISTSNPNYFLAGTFYSIYLFDKEKLIKVVKPDMIVDGIYLKNQTGKKAIGDLATAQDQYNFNTYFEFDLDTFELTMNQKVIRNDYKIFETVRVLEKDWIEKPNLIQRLINKLSNK